MASSLQCHCIATWQINMVSPKDPSSVAAFKSQNRGKLREGQSCSQSTSTHVAVATAQKHNCSPHHFIPPPSSSFAPEKKERKWKQHGYVWADKNKPAGAAFPRQLYAYDYEAAKFGQKWVMTFNIPATMVASALSLVQRYHACISHQMQNSWTLKLNECVLPQLRIVAGVYWYAETKSRYAWTKITSMLCLLQVSWKLVFD